MRAFRTTALAALIITVPLAGASASDLIAYPTSTAAELPVYDDPGFDWNGFYAGVYGVAQTSPAGGEQLGIGVAAGVNAAFDFYLAGAEIALQGLTGEAGETSYAEVLARGGLVVTDNVAVYAAAGYGIDTGAPEENDFLLGGGVEVAVADNMTLRAQYIHAFPSEGDNPKDQISFGANFHF